MFTETTSLGLDVHARSVHAAAIDGTTRETIEKQLSVDPLAITTFAGDLAREHGPLRITYEAGPTGFGLARTVQAAGHMVQVAAPSKLIRPAGERAKTDRRDARLLAVWTVPETSCPSGSPAVSKESARDLVRARDDARRDLMFARHRLGRVSYSL